MCALGVIALSGAPVPCGLCECEFPTAPTGKWLKFVADEVKGRPRSSEVDPGLSCLANRTSCNRGLTALDALADS